ncbi:MAG: shikimate kinase [Acidobacteria bacterium]|nr:MAG: shikimate kinase [Acidobacteriota bacterium]
MRRELIFLVGFMGVGKSTVGALLSTRLGWEFIDLDQEIEKTHSQSIREIFEHQGELQFRKMETEALQNLKLRVRCVVALGGGAFAQENNRDLIRDMGYSFFLDCPLEYILNRCPIDGTRPLFKTRTQLQELFAVRLPHYQTCDFRIEISNLSPQDIVDRIVKQMIDLYSKSSGSHL